MSKVMLVEDDSSLREIYSIRLTAEGYTIVSAGDGEEALAVAVRERPDLIVSDVMMPKISGFDMLDILRSTPETKDIKIIMMTALSSDDQRERGENLGADRFLVKSQVGIEDVVNAVHDVLGDRAGADGMPPANEMMANVTIPQPQVSVPAEPNAMVMPTQPTIDAMPTPQQMQATAPTMLLNQGQAAAQVMQQTAQTTNPQTVPTPPAIPGAPVPPAETNLTPGQMWLVLVRLNKFLAERLGISRREADGAIAAGKVQVDGKTAVLGARIELPDSISSENVDAFSGETPTKDAKRDFSIDFLPKVCYNGSMVPVFAGYIYLALNKPAGYVCSRRRQGEVPTIYEILPKKYQGLKTVGRLDKDSSGLILLTNDGDFAFRMTHPKFSKMKVYEVELDQALAPLRQQMIADFGVEIGDGVSRLGLERLSDDRKSWRVTMSEGRNRQIRRTFAALGYTVLKLKRLSFGIYQLGGLREGEFVEVEKI